MAKTAERASARYLPLEPANLAWGARVLDSGFTVIPPCTDYPPGHHPAEYLFTWKAGRVLNEHQVVYITAGEGSFESRSAGRRQIRAGQAFLLFPGEWHRYRPRRSTGWHESWIGFDGDYAGHLLRQFFAKKDPVLTVGLDEELLRLFRAVDELSGAQAPGDPAIIAVRAIEVLARLRQLASTYRRADREMDRKIQQARMVLLDRVGEPVDLVLLAREVGLGYSNFRSAFRQVTGASPRQYQLRIRLNYAQSLLRQSALPIGEIAERLGFSSLFYFSRFFKQHARCSPREFRSRRRNPT